MKLILVSCGLIISLIPVSELPGQADSATDQPAIQAGHSYHGESFNEGPRQQAFLMEGLGRCRFPVTTKQDDAQAFFNQGIDQLHGFWYFEAERSFRQAAILDPDCVMAWWGLAMANINNQDRAVRFMEQATAKIEGNPEICSEREKQWVEALAGYYRNPEGNKKKRARALAQALEDIVLAHPDDIEAKAFLVCQIWMNERAGIPVTSHAGVDALLDAIFTVDPWHPAHHYRIHLWDYRKPEQALQSAARGGPALPAIAHMWHMPGHIYSRLKRYEDAVYQQEASARVDHRHMMRDRVLPDQIHNFAHNNEWCIRNLNHIGRVDDAVELATNMISMPRHPQYNHLDKRGSAWYGRQRLMMTLANFEMWEQAIDACHGGLLEPTDDPEQQIGRLRFLGRALYRSGQTNQGDAVLEDLLARQARWNREQAEKTAEAVANIEEKHRAMERGSDSLARWLDQRVPGFADHLTRQLRRSRRQTATNRRQSIADKGKSRSDLLANAIQEMQGHQAVASGDFARGHELLEKAGEVDALYRASIRLNYDDPHEVLKDARKYVDSREHEVQPLAMLAWLQWQAGRQDEAVESFQRLRDHSSSIDMQSPVFQRLQPLAGHAGISGDWRIPAVAADDLGERPDLDALGPWCWSPWQAESWELPDAAGATVSSKQFHTKPLLLIFYLGHGCLHCTEQLQEFAPRVDAFREAGIEILAISTDAPRDLQKSLDHYSQEAMPIQLVADPEHAVFRQFRAWDDFEQQPLHGTFLIDGNGHVRWQDISYEPFMDAEFLLQESQRLLAIEPPVASGS